MIELPPEHEIET